MSRFPRPRPRAAPPLWVVAALALAAMPMAASAQGGLHEATDPNPGFGLIAAAGQTDAEAPLRRFGFSSRRMRDGDRMGALTLQGEEIRNGVPLVVYAPDLRREEVSLVYQSVYLELKRYFPLGGPWTYYWGLRGGYSRLTGTVSAAPGRAEKTFQQEQAAPFWFLSLPLVLENPGFLLLGLLEGGSAGIAMDLVRDRIWLEAQVSGTVIPQYRDARLAVAVPYLLTGSVSLTIAL
jgi:hypothetical protein